MAPHRLRKRVAHLALSCLMTRQVISIWALPKSVLDAKNPIDQQVHPLRLSPLLGPVPSEPPGVVKIAVAAGLAKVLCWRAAL